MSGQFKTFDTNTINEQWHKSMSTVAQEDYPGQTLFGSDSINTTTAFWFSDALADPNGANARLEGDVSPESNLTKPQKFANHTQIFSKSAEVSRTLRSSATLGSTDEFVRQFDKISREVKRDVETAIMGTQGSVEATASAAGRLAGVCATITTNVTENGGSTPGYTSPVYGSLVVAADTVALTEDMFNDAMQSVREAGGKADTVLVGGTLKRTISKFDGNSTKYQDATKKKIFNTVDTYTGDFGTYNVIADFFMPKTTVLGVDPSKVVLSYLDKWQKYDNAKVGDSDKKTLVGELTVKSLDERSSFRIANVH